MRKRILDNAASTETHSVAAAATTGAATETWMDLLTIAAVEISSEAEGYPIEHALGAVPAAAANTGWRADTTGPQTIRLHFDQPVTIRRIRLHLIERNAERSQEIAIYAGATDADLRQVVRQQFTFSPGGATEEIEDYTVGLKDVTVFELRIDPDRAHDPSQSQHYAALAELRLA